MGLWKIWRYLYVCGFLRVKVMLRHCERSEKGPSEQRTPLFTMQSFLLNVNILPRDDLQGVPYYYCTPVKGSNMPLVVSHPRPTMVMWRYRQKVWWMQWASNCCQLGEGLRMSPTTDHLHTDSAALLYYARICNICLFFEPMYTSINCSRLFFVQHNASVILNVYGLSILHCNYYLYLAW